MRVLFWNIVIKQITKWIHSYQKKCNPTKGNLFFNIKIDYLLLEHPKDPCEQAVCEPLQNLYAAGCHLEQNELPTGPHWRFVCIVAPSRKMNGGLDYIMHSHMILIKQPKKLICHNNIAILYRFGAKQSEYFFIMIYYILCLICKKIN